MRMLMHLGFRVQYSLWSAAQNLSRIGNKCFGEAFDVPKKSQFSQLTKRVSFQPSQRYRNSWKGRENIWGSLKNQTRREQALLMSRWAFNKMLCTYHIYVLAHIQKIIRSAINCSGWSPKSCHTELYHQTALVCSSNVWFSYHNTLPAHFSVGLADH